LAIGPPFASYFASASKADRNDWPWERWYNDPARPQPRQTFAVQTENEGERSFSVRTAIYHLFSRRDLCRSNQLTLAVDVLSHYYHGSIPASPRNR